MTDIVCLKHAVQQNMNFSTIIKMKFTCIAPYPCPMSRLKVQKKKKVIQIMFAACVVAIHAICTSSAGVFTIASSISRHTSHWISHDVAFCSLRTAASLAAIVGMV